MIITTFDPYKQKTVQVGYTIDNIFFKPVNRKKHYLRIAHGYAIQDDVFHKLEELGIEKIIFVEDKKKELEITFADFNFHKGNWNYNHGNQYTINEKFLKETVIK